MSSKFVRAATGLAVLTAAGLASAQTYSTYPGYGYTHGAGIVRCESNNSRSNFCRVDTRGGVQLVRQLSREDCVRGRNWSVSTEGIHVDDGCRAEFAVGNAYATTSGGRYIGTDRYGQPLYTTGSAYVTDRYGNRIYVSSADMSRGYVVDRYGNRIMLTGHRYSNTGGIYTGNTGGYYTTDRYGNRVWVPAMPTSTSSGYYVTDRYGNRTWVSTVPSSTGGGHYTTDRYGNRVWVSTTSGGGYYTTDRYGNRIWVDTGAGGYYTDEYGRVVTSPTYRYDMDVDNDGIDDAYEGYGAYGGTYTSPSSSSASVIYCNSAATGRTYCGDRNLTYTLDTQGSSNCLYNRTYGRDENGTWVSGGCNLRMTR